MELQPLSPTGRTDVHDSSRARCYSCSRGRLPVCYCSMLPVVPSVGGGGGGGGGGPGVCVLLISPAGTSAWEGSPQVKNVSCASIGGGNQQASSSAPPLFLPRVRPLAVRGALGFSGQNSEVHIFEKQKTNQRVIFR